MSPPKNATIPSVPSHSADKSSDEPDSALQLAKGFVHLKASFATVIWAQERLEENENLIEADSAYDRETEQWQWDALHEDEETLANLKADQWIGYYG